MALPHFVVAFLLLFAIASALALWVFRSGLYVTLCSPIYWMCSAVGRCLVLIRETRENIIRNLEERNLDMDDIELIFQSDNPMLAMLAVEESKRSRIANGTHTQDGSNSNHLHTHVITAQTLAALSDSSLERSCVNGPSCSGDMDIENLLPIEAPGHERLPTCAICLQQFSIGDYVSTTSCRHNFHQQCIQRWLQLKRICPLCNAEQ